MVFIIDKIFNDIFIYGKKFMIEKIFRWSWLSESKVWSINFVRVD